MDEKIFVIVLMWVDFVVVVVDFLIVLLDDLMMDELVGGLLCDVWMCFVVVGFGVLVLFFIFVGFVVVYIGMILFWLLYEVLLMV